MRAARQYFKGERKSRDITYYIVGKSFTQEVEK